MPGRGLRIEADDREQGGRGGDPHGPVIVASSGGEREQRLRSPISPSRGRRAWRSRILVGELADHQIEAAVVAERDQRHGSGEPLDELASLSTSAALACGVVADPGESLGGGDPDGLSLFSSAA